MTLKSKLVPSNFQMVSNMNMAFGNRKGHHVDFYYPEALGRVRNQVWNILDEFGETLTALGYDADVVKIVLACAAKDIKAVGADDDKCNRDKARDGLCDINVFSYGAHHIMGYDADQDMRAVIAGVMSRFIKDEADKAATIAMHARKGVTEVYFEGEFPVMVMKSACDQPDAPKGKFLKSASYKEPRFVATPGERFPATYGNMHIEDSDDMLMEFARQVWLISNKGSTRPTKQLSVYNTMAKWSKTFQEFKDDELQKQYEIFKGTLRLIGVLK